MQTFISAASVRKMVLSFVPLAIIGCTLSREQFGRYYWIGAGAVGVSRDLLEERLTTLYTAGSLQTNHKVWIALLNKHAKQGGGEVILRPRDFDNGYALDHAGRKEFLVYHSQTKTFYAFSFWNFRGLRKQHTPCDLVIDNIMTLQLDSTLNKVEWKGAGPALATFKQSILPIIRQGVREK